MHVLCWCRFKCFVFPVYLLYVSYSIDICTVAIKYISQIFCILTKMDVIARTISVRILKPITITINYFSFLTLFDLGFQ